MSEPLFDEPPAPVQEFAEPAWPPALIDAELAVDLLREALAEPEGMAPHVAFLRTLGPWDRELLAEKPSEVVLDAALGREVLARRYGLYLLLNTKPAGRVRIDEDALRAIEKQVGATSDAVQKVVSRFMAAKDNLAMKEANAVHASLGRTLGDVRTLARRLAGQTGASGPLDGDGARVATFDMQSAKPLAPAAPVEEAFKRQDLEKGSPWPLRIAAIVAIAALGIFVAVRQLPPPGAKRWTAATTNGLANVVSIDSKKEHAVVTVTAAWKADPQALQLLKERLRNAGIDRVVVVNGGGRAVAIGRTSTGIEPVAQPGVK